MIQTRLWFRGEVSLFDHGKLFHRSHNMVVQAGLDYIMNLLETAGAAARPSHMACGTSGLAPALSQTALGAEVQRKTITTGRVSATITYTSAAFGPALGAPASVQEFGIFNAAGGGTMLARFTCPVFTLDSTRSVIAVWRLTAE